MVGSPWNANHGGIAKKWTGRMVVSVIPPNFGRMKTGGRVAKYVNCELIEALKFMAPYDPF